MAGTNRMVEKSKRNIKDALLELMYEKDFNLITVNELLGRANISRGTFYAHFQNLEDVRQQLISDLFARASNMFRDYKAIELATDPRPVIEAATQLMNESRDSVKRLFKFINVYDLGVSLTAWLTEYILSDDELVDMVGGMDIAKTYARYAAGGIMNAYNMWIADDFDIEPELFVNTLFKMLMNGVNGIFLSHVE